MGPNHVLVMANSSLAIYDKTGAKVWPPNPEAARDINSIWTGFGGACETENAGDPVVLYDQFADRWLISQFTGSGPTYYQCFALSTTGDPTGTWQRYAFNDGSSLGDYPKYGIWRDGYYFSSRHTSGTTGQRAVAVERDQMLAGSLAPQVVQFLLAPGSTAYYGGDGLLPADMDGDTLPPVGAPELFFGTMDTGGPYSAPQDAIYMYRFHVDWTTPANSTFTRVSPDLAVAAFDSTFTPCGGGRTCIGQLDTTNKIDILSYRQRPTFRAAYRNYGTHESVALTQSVSGYNSGTASAIAGMRWYELRGLNGTPTLYQQGTYVPGATDGIHRWMGSVAMDHVGNMALGFSASSASMYPGIWYAGRLASDPLGTMPQGEGVIVNGAGSQTSGGSRWGDYTSLNVDPVDDCTFWHFNEYYSSTSASNWQMRVGSFTFPSCLCAAIPAAPTASGGPNGDNRIDVSWNDSATTTITRYYVLRGTISGGPYELIATVTDTSPGAGGGAPYTYQDLTVSGGTTYHYVVRSNDGDKCSSPNSNQVSATASGVCLLSPTFAGLTSVSNPQNATCTLNLSWAAGGSNCAGTLAYNVYRATSPGFTPGPGNLLAAAVSGTSYADSAALASGTPYYYVVRAVDAVNGAEETNTVERSGTATGTITSATLWTESFDATTFPPTGWAQADTSGTSGNWARSTATVHPSGTAPYSGAGLAYFNSYTATSGNNTRLYRTTTTAIPGGVTSAAVTFAMYHDTGYASYADRIQVQVSTNGTTWTDVGAAVNRYDGSTGWKLHSVDLSSYKGQSIQVALHGISVYGNDCHVDAVTLGTTTAASCTPAMMPPGEAAPGDQASTAQAWSADKGTHSWPALSQATSYTVYRGTPAQLPGLLDGTTDSCTRYSGAATSFAASETPGAGSFYWYLVLGANGGGSGPAGNATAGARVVNTSGNCP